MKELKKYEDLANRLNQITDKLWDKVIFITVDSIIKEEIEASKISELAESLSDKVTAKKAEFNNAVERVPESEYDEYEHARIEELYYDASHKVDYIAEIADKFYEISNSVTSSEAKKRLSKFNSVPTIELGESFQPIKLSRLADLI